MYNKLPKELNNLNNSKHNICYSELTCYVMKFLLRILYLSSVGFYYHFSLYFSKKAYF